MYTEACPKNVIKIYTLTQELVVRIVLGYRRANSRDKPTTY